MIRRVQVRCPNCLMSNLIPYVLLGAPGQCGSCGESVTWQTPVGAPYPVTQYEVAFADFLQLVGNKAYRSTIGALLQRWFALGIEGDGDAAVVRSVDGETVDLVGLHVAIQDDSAKQAEFYRTAMALWQR